MMAVVNGGIYPHRGCSGVEAFSAGDRPRGGAAKYPAAWPVLPDQSAGIRADRHAVLTTTSVMLVSIGLAGIGYRLQQTPELTPHSSTRNARRQGPDQSLAC